MSYQYYITDVFTRELFGGAQIAVFPQATGLADEQMALIAQELALTETVFVFNSPVDPHRRVMRIFTPHGEIDFAGHPVIATAYVLGHCGDIQLAEPLTQMVFEQNSGPVEVNISARDGRPSLVQFTRKVASVVDRFAPSDQELAGFLSLRVADLDHNKYAPRLVSCGFPYLIVPLWSYASVRKARFNYATWSQSVAPQTAAQEILLFAPKTPYPDADFNLRLLGPNIGLQEDPPVGNAIPAFAAYLCSFDFTRKGTYTFAVDRGDADSRRSVLNIEMDNKGEALLPLRVGGEAVIFAEGTILI
ncbi:PhzF family phenazine biosynthesis protein [Methylomarinum sp. Ch1-1]|uniref:PhzF family phenazine biosynthesis protein n=1 Tax=Methylomarinum roseum TaxID=3067653 RepID=A0AAU7NX21_9GAMM|nr:PhzF family phenazine biosynthesis protein [Methylomarinum sp. Ch1-1]MDP4522429.1 PhzF family phenazine biosynthesis protein [Methylomarinum sp. Ch1-1]